MINLNGMKTVNGVQPDMNETEVILKIKIFHHRSLQPQKAVNDLKANLPDNILSVEQMALPVTEEFN